MLARGILGQECCFIPTRQAVKAQTMELLGKGVAGDKGKGKGEGKGGKGLYPAGKGRRSVHRPVS